MTRRFAAVFLTLALAPRAARAAFDDAPFGARDAAMGGAFTAVHDDVSSLAYNPAALGQAPELEVGASYLRGLHWPAGTIDRDITRAALAVPVRQEIFNGAFGFDVRYDRRQGLARDRQIGVFYGTRGLREMQDGGLDFGCGLKFLQSSFEGRGGAQTKPALDMGALWRVGAKRSVAASLLNFGGAKFKSGPLSDRAPLALKIGAAESIRGALIAVDATIREPSSGQGKAVTFAAGFERWWATERAGAFAARSGLSLGDRARTWHWGFGWKNAGARLDYSLLTPLAGLIRFGHGITLSLRFGRTDPEEEYERLLSGEMRARRDLNKKLEANSVKQWKLSEEIGRLQAELASLRSAIAGKHASEEEARRRLSDMETRHKKAVDAFQRLQEEHAHNAARTKAELFGEDWSSYQKAKLAGAPDEALLERVQRLLVEYKESGVDLGEASRELGRLQKAR
ncbi:MAG TPA: hypothetical protein DCZ01_08095 [Elusimicrobia bacterium]|nr:MAG: hypothetical protein A2X37_09410 [Elusimicrobia bacterium GWA2_66_18]HAZ08465.1 hypothetical protein [Elusimicrobiota bacterium]